VEDLDSPTVPDGYDTAVGASRDVGVRLDVEHDQAVGPCRDIKDVHAFDTEEFIGKTPQCPGRTYAVSHCQALSDSVWLVSPPVVAACTVGVYSLVDAHSVVPGCPGSPERQKHGSARKPQQRPYELLYDGPEGAPPRSSR
jgi:hypothetical protein